MSHAPARELRGVLEEREEDSRERVVGAAGRPPEELAPGGESRASAHQLAEGGLRRVVHARGPYLERAVESLEPGGAHFCAPPREDARRAMKRVADVVGDGHASVLFDDDDLQLRDVDARGIAELARFAACVFSVGAGEDAQEWKDVLRAPAER